MFPLYVNIIGYFGVVINSVALITIIMHQTVYQYYGLQTDIQNLKMNLVNVTWLVGRMQTVDEVMELVEQLEDYQVSVHPLANCEDAGTLGLPTGPTLLATSPVTGSSHKRVWCVQDNKWGKAGWTVWLHRERSTDPEQLSFKQSVDSYNKGFGDVAGEHWLGLEMLNILTTRDRQQELLVTMTRGDEEAFAIYGNFSVGPSAAHRLTVGDLWNFTQGVGDGMAVFADQPFTIPARLDDESSGCADDSGWWWPSDSIDRCSLPLLTGLSTALTWPTWGLQPLTSITFMFRTATERPFIRITPDNITRGVNVG